MAASSEFLELIKDLLASLGTVSLRRMFGGAGIYVDGHFIAIVDNDVLYFKTDAASRRRFEAEGMGPFTYDTRHGPGTLLSYWRAPERLLDDAEEMCDWAGEALAVARRVPASKRRATGSPSRSASPRVTGKRKARKAARKPK